MRRIVAVVLAASVLAPGGAVAADASSEEGSGEKVAFGAAAVVGTVIYAPLKGLLCVIGGGFGAAAAFVSSGSRAAKTVANASCKGTWIIRPEILRGEKPLDMVPESPCCGYPNSP